MLMMLGCAGLKLMTLACCQLSDKGSLTDSMGWCACVWGVGPEPLMRKFAGSLMIRPNGRSGEGQPV